MAAGMVISAGIQAVSDYLKQRAANRQNDKQIAADKARATQAVGAREAELDPFRQQMAQASALSKLDLISRMNNQARQTDFSSSPYAKYIPKSTGGPSYEKSPDLIAWLTSLQRDVASGHSAPTMTNPANYGRTAALDMNRTLGGDTGMGTGGGLGPRAQGSGGSYGGPQPSFAGAGPGMASFSGGSYVPPANAAAGGGGPAMSPHMQDALARAIYSNLKAAGHDVKWNGNQLLVDGRPYELGQGFGDEGPQAQLLNG
jgi:hypothetical protein